MNIEIELDGVRHQVALRREGEEWVAGIDGRDVAVSVAAAGGRWSMLVLPPEGGSHGSHQQESVASGFGRKSDQQGAVASGFSRKSDQQGAVASGFSRKSYDISFESGAGGDLIVHVNGVAIPVTVIDGRRRRGSRSATSDARSRAIVAPMPGRIVKVLVRPGEAVVARQPLVVVEAMKMENELRAPRGGTVIEVRVSEGASVEANAVLVVLE